MQRRQKDAERAFLDVLSPAKFIEAECSNFAKLAITYTSSSLLVLPPRMRAPIMELVELWGFCVS